MRDDSRPGGSNGDADGSRDRRLASMLEVEPLDDVTRRRLVGTAMQSAGSGARRARLLVVAAAVVLVVVAGGSILIGLRGGGSDRTASRPPSTAAATPAFGSAPSVRNLGDLGDLDHVDMSAVARTVLGAAADSARAGSASAAPATSTPIRVDALAARLRTLTCRDRLPEGALLALGTGRVAGKDALVVATRGDDGVVSIDAITADPCEVHPLS
jgi:hypothetical protein